MSEQPDKGEYKLAIPKGQYGYVRFARCSSGDELAWDFWQRITLKQRAVFLTSFRMIVDSPTLQLFKREKFKQVERELFEFKNIRDQMRLFCFRDVDGWYLTSGMEGKKEDALPPGEVKRALEIMDDCRSALAARRKKNLVI